MKDTIERFLCGHPDLYLQVLRATGRGSREKRAFLALLHAGDVVFDVGANRGHFTRLFARLTGDQGAVHAFEPGAGTFALLRDGMERAGRPGHCTLNHCALGETSGVATLHLPGTDDGQASLRMHTDGSWSAAQEVQHFECAVKTLDEYAAEFSRLDFIKCDVEGAELTVIRGGRATLLRHLPMLWLESNPDWTRAFDYTPADLIGELRSLGYDTFLVERAGLAPLQERDLEGNINLLCARADRHEKRLARLTKNLTMGWKRTTLELFTGKCAKFAPHALAAPANPESIFVLRNNDLGDLLVITPLFEALKRRFPAARIVAGVGDRAAPILAGNPHVDEVLSMNAPWHNGQVKSQGLAAAFRYILCSSQAARLAKARCEVGIDVLGSPQGSLLLMRAGIPWRMGVKGYAGGHSAAQQCVEYHEHEHVGRAALRFAELLGATDLPENRPQIYLPAKPPEHGAIVFAPGGGFGEKCWSIASFASLLDRLAPQRVVVIGGERDRALGAELAAGRSHVRDCTGTTSLPETFALIAGARAVVCNSSMAMHAAAAFRKPCLVLLGEYFADDAQHAAQWAYPESRVLGRRSGHPEVWTAEEAYPILQSLLPSS